jgi:hypothetical protein
MKTFFLRLVPAILGAFILQVGFSQQMDSVMSVYETQFPKEKIHIHFDRNVYNRDETIWYKVYILSGSDLSTLSKNVYVEWYDTSGKMIKQTVAPLFQSTAKGSFDLPGGYTGDFVHVKAYTRWMLNDDSTFIYSKDILLNTTMATGQKKPAVIIPRTEVTVFPEGGVLVQGITSRVAFKATDQFGVPVKIKGAVYAGKVFIDTLIVKHDGMGNFFLTPQPGESYQLNWTDETGKKGSLPITAAKAQGATIAIRGTNDKALVQIQRSADVQDNFKRLTLFVHMNQSLFYKVSINATEKTSINAQIPIDELPTGILQFTLFTSDWIPVAERILFVNNHQHEFNAKVTLPLVNVEKRGKNAVDIMVSDTAFSNMSLSITDAAIAMPDPNSIYSDILLSGDIKGKVYNPAYYLTSDADSVTDNLDLVMLTNGWRKFDWEKIKAGVLPKLQYPKETEFLKIGGKVYGIKPNMAANGLQLNFIIMAKDSSKQFQFASVGRDGLFQINNQFFYDTVRVFYNFNGNSKLTDVTQVQMDNGLLRQVAKKTTFGNKNPLSLWGDSLLRAKMNFIFSEQEKLRKSMATTTLQEVIVKAKVKSPLLVLEEKYATGLFSGGDGYSFDMEENGRVSGAVDVLGFLQSKVPGLLITGSGTQATLSWRGATPDLYLNEMQSQVDMIQSVSIQDIAFIKVFRPPFFGSVGGGSGGAIAVYTKKGSDTRKADPNAKGMENTILGGYSRFKEFFNPSYEKPNDNTADPDLRTTLYWNPYIITNKKSPRIRITFFNNDISKRFQLVLEGVNGDGKMTRVVKLIDSKSQD